VEGKRPEIPPCPAQYRELIEGCWAGDPEMRPNFDTIIQKLELVSAFVQEHPDDHSTVTPSVADKETPKSEGDAESPKASPKSREPAKSLTKSPSSSSRRAARHSKVSLAEGTEEFATFVSNLKRQRSMSTPPPINPDLLESDLDKKDKEKKKKKSSRLRDLEEGGSSRERRKSSKGGSFEMKSSEESHSPLIKRQPSKIPSLQLPNQTLELMKQDEIILQRVHEGSSQTTMTTTTTSSSQELATTNIATIAVTESLQILDASEITDLASKVSDAAVAESVLESLKELDAALPASPAADHKSTPASTEGRSESGKESRSDLSIDASTPIDTPAQKQPPPHPLSLASSTSVPSLPMIAPQDYPYGLMKASSSSSRKSPKGISSGFSSMRERPSPGNTKVSTTSVDDINSHKDKSHNVPSTTIGSERFGELMKLFQHKWRSSTSK